MAPYDSEDARGLLKAAIRDPDPVVFLENEILYGQAFPVEDKVMEKDFTLPIGKCKVGQSPASLHFCITLVKQEIVVILLGIVAIIGPIICIIIDDQACMPCPCALGDWFIRLFMSSCRFSNIA